MTGDDPLEPVLDELVRASRELGELGVRSQEELVRALPVGLRTLAARRLARIRRTGEAGDERELVLGSGLFDERWYRRAARLYEFDVDALDDFLSRSGPRTPEPHPLFDPGYYLNQIALDERPQGNPLVHFLQGGWRERNPHPLFDAAFYRDQARGAVPADEIPLLHFLREGAAAGLDPCSLFSVRYYGEQVDVDPARLNPLVHYLAYGAREGKDPHPAFSTTGYLDAYPDVRASGRNPLVHYVLEGRHEGREARPRAAPRVALADGLAPADAMLSSGAIPRATIPLRVGFVSGLRGLPSDTYRVLRRVEALRACGRIAYSIGAGELVEQAPALAFCDLVVLHRVPWSDAVGVTVERLRRAGVLVVFDVDDLLFEPELASSEHVDRLRLLDERGRGAYLEEVLALRRTAEEADACVGSTRFLCERLAALGKPAFHLANGFDLETVKRADGILRASPDSVGRIGYASGTPTHQRDFGQAAAAVARVLAERPGARLAVVGELVLDEFDELRPFADRIERRPLVPAEALLAEYARFTVNLAPLEPGNPICEAKSEIKWSEPALVGVPTVASPTATFSDAIADGVDGLLAGSEDEWHAAIAGLLDDDARRRSLGDRAREDVVVRYGPEAVRRDTAEVVERLLELRGRVRPAPSALETVAFVLPQAERSLALANALCFARLLARGGLGVHCCFVGADDAQPPLRELAAELDLFEGGLRVSAAPQLFARAGAVVLAGVAGDAAEGAGPAVRLIQDPGADLPLLLGDAPGTGAVALGTWAAREISRLAQAEAGSLPEPLDHTTFNADRPPPRADRRIVVFAGDGSDPRAVAAVVAGVALAGRQAGPLDVVAVGRGLSGCPHPWLDGAPESAVERALLYREAALGIVVSGFGPANPVHEMMACALPILVPAQAGSRAEEWGGAVVAGPGPSDLASALVSLLADRERRATSGASLREQALALPGWEEAAGELRRVLERAATGR